MVFSGRKEVPYSEIKKGYEIAKDQYVMIEKQDLEKIAVESTSTINIRVYRCAGATCKLIGS